MQHLGRGCLAAVKMAQPIAKDPYRLQGHLTLYAEAGSSGHLREIGMALGDHVQLDADAEPITGVSDTIEFRSAGLNFELGGHFKWGFQLYLDCETVDSVQESSGFDCEGNYGF
jgi:hypothetical protein